MSALRGRVLGDEEAAKYWDQRGAEPGGQGVRAGVFRDDPASRSTQRRGAPGRKAWVKPPPKPVVVDRTKELDAKRNFLALKVGAMGSLCCYMCCAVLCCASVPACTCVWWRVLIPKVRGLGLTTLFSVEGGRTFVFANGDRLPPRPRLEHVILNWDGIRAEALIGFGFRFCS